MMEGMTFVSFVVLPDPLLSTYPFTNAASYYFLPTKRFWTAQQFWDQSPFPRL